MRRWHVAVGLVVLLVVGGVVWRVGPPVTWPPATEVGEIAGFSGSEIRANRGREWAPLSWVRPVITDSAVDPVSGRFAVTISERLPSVWEITDSGRMVRRHSLEFLDPGGFTRGAMFAFTADGRIVSARSPYGGTEVWISGDGHEPEVVLDLTGEIDAFAGITAIEATTDGTVFVLFQEALWRVNADLASDRIDLPDDVRGSRKNLTVSGDSVVVSFGANDDRDGVALIIDDPAADDPTFDELFTFDFADGDPVSALDLGDDTFMVASRSRDEGAPVLSRWRPDGTFEVYVRHSEDAPRLAFNGPGMTRFGDTVHLNRGFFTAVPDP